MDIILGIANEIIRVISLFWWVAFPFVVFLFFWEFWLMFARHRYVQTISWSLLEISIPQNIEKTPKAMEQVFTEMVQLSSFGMSFINTSIEGKVENWASFEMVGYNGNVRFYAYIPSKFRNLLESAIYAQYSEAEINEVEDYTEVLASTLPNQVYDLWGTELILARENCYPIRTYHYFEDPKDEKRIDPVSAITEAMSNLKEGEMVWLSFLISPTGKIVGNDWQEDGKKVIADVTGRDTGVKKKGGAFSSLGDWLTNLVIAPAQLPVWGGEKKEEKAQTFKFLHPGETEAVKEIGNKISKVGFETIIRFVYIDRKDSFSSANISAVLGSFQQYNTQHMNSFKPNKKVTTLKVGWLAKLFPKYKNLCEFSKKKKIFSAYRERRFGLYNRTRQEKFSILTPEELATIYHFPITSVEAPNLKRIETKRGGAPSGLPIG
jgi:hypothetical protein